MTLKADLYSLVQPIIGGTVIWADQNKPLPAKPYSTIKVMSMRHVNYDHYKDPDNTGIQKVTGDREFTLNVRRFGDDSVEELNTFNTKLRLISNIEKFIEKKLPIIRSENVVDTSTLNDQSYIETSASLDVFLRMKSELSENVGYIDTITIQKDDDYMDEGQTVQTEQTIDLINIVGP